MTREELIKILEDYEIFVDDDFGGSYKSIIAYTSDKKVSRAHTPIGTLKIIDTFEEIQNQNKKCKEVIDKAIMYVNSTRYCDTKRLKKYSIKEFWFIKELEDILKEVE